MRKLENEMEATRNDSEKIVSLFNFAKGASRTGKNFGKVCTSKRNTSELSEGNGEERKRAERNFDEKML